MNNENELNKMDDNNDLFNISECWNIFLEAWLNKGNGQKPMDMFDNIINIIKTERENKL
jgi:hypothetical protein